jgi:hypothetical protein
LPWNESHLDIRSDHLDPSRFDRDTIRTIAISEADGIEAVVGKPPGRDYELTFSFLFAKSKGWTVEKAQDWFRAHEHTAGVPLGHWPVGGSAALNPGGRHFDSMKATVGDLVNVNRKVGASQERSESIQICPDDSACRRLHDTMGLQCSGLCKVSASLNQNSVGHFNQMQYTVGDLVGKKPVEAAAASEPPTVHRIADIFDPMQVTVGDLVTKTTRGHTSGRTISIEPGDIAMHPSKIRMCSR